MLALHGVRSFFLTANPELALAQAAEKFAIGYLVKPYTDNEAVTAVQAVESWLCCREPEQESYLKFFSRAVQSE
jgi:hypothetical protein